MTDEDNKDPWMADRPAARPPQQGGRQSRNDRPPGWERELIEKLAMHGLREQRRSRRWGLFFKGLLFVYLFSLLFLYWPSGDQQPAGSGSDHTALVEVRGVIADDSEANADSIIAGLRAAFRSRHTRGVVLQINSPGGSPVQAGYVYDEIRRLRHEHPDTKVYAVVTDMCASGGYYIAAAADYIYADKASIVGSIGVRMDGFGFVDAIKKLGIERRLLTAGQNKGMLDPFLPEKVEEKRHAETLLNAIHRQFIQAVKDGRGERLNANPDIFSGLIWTGEQGVELGLVDGLGSSDYVARDLIGAEKIVNYTRQPPLLDRLVERMGVTMASALSRWSLQLF